MVLQTLMLNSPVFYQMFSGAFKEAKSDRPTVPLPDKSMESVMWMLDFLYHKLDTMTGMVRYIHLILFRLKYGLTSLISI